MSDEGIRRVSVVIPAYNAASFIGEAIESVLGQSYRPIELVVVDDSSTDRTWEIISEFGTAVISERNEQNRGACYSRNRGMELSSGDFLMFLDADDRIAPDTIEALVGVLQSTGGGLAASNWRFLVRVGADWLPVDSGFSREPPNDDYLLGWLEGWYVPPCALLWSRKTLEGIGPWDESLAANQDGDMVLRALLAGTDIKRAEGGLALYRKFRGARHSISDTVSIPSVRSRSRVFSKVEQTLAAHGTLERYRVALGRSYYELAREAYAVDFVTAEECEAEAWRLAGSNAASGTLSHRLVASLIGLGPKERFASLLRKGIQGLRSVAG
ncbi:MAG: glycosyltransferase family A protein [Gemmatimonadaceae bacterium]